MVFLTKIKTELKEAEIKITSEMNDMYDQLKAANLSAILFKGKKNTIFCFNIFTLFIT